MGWGSHLLVCLYHLPGRLGFKGLEALCWWQQHLSLYVCLISPLPLHGNSAQGFPELAQLQYFIILYLCTAILWELIIIRSVKKPSILIIGQLVLSSPNYSPKWFELYIIHSVDLSSCGAEIWHFLSYEAWLFVLAMPAPESNSHALDKDLLGNLWLLAAPEQ